MENRNPFFSLKNFRSFGEDGADFELAPITVLTGCNSAGKSSISKALTLLSKLPRRRDDSSPSLKIYSKDLNLGTFENVLNRQIDNKKIVFAYQIWSNYLQEEVLVKRFFRRKGDALGDGEMSHFVIEKMDGTIILDQNSSPFNADKDVKNWESISQNFDNFCLVYNYTHLVLYVDILRKKGKDSDDKHCQVYKRLEDVKQQLMKNRINVENYKHEFLNNWEKWVRDRNEEIDKRKKVKANEGMIAELFPEDQIHNHFMDLVVDEVLFPWFIKDVIYINSDSARIERSYSVEDDNKMCDALRRFNNRMVEDQEWITVNLHEPSYYQPGRFMNHWLEKERFNIGEVSIEGNGEGGIKIYLKNDDDKRLLADEGYGITQLVSLLLLIDNAIDTEGCEEVPMKDGRLDYKGRSYGRPAQIICVEEPEIHLHPKFQSMLAEMFVEAYQQYNIRFIIETHSEYLIRKLQVMVADKDNTLTSNDVSLNYVDKDENGISHNRQIKILDDGGLSGQFGSGFFDEADGLALELFRHKPILS